MLPNEVTDSLNHVGDHLRAKTGEDAKPEGPFGNRVGVRERSDHAMRDVGVRGLTKEIATEQQSRGDAT